MYRIIGICLMVWLCGCSVVKKATETLTVTATLSDSAVVVKVKSRADSTSRERDSRDTAIGIPGRHIGYTIPNVCPPGDCERDTLIKNGSMTMKVYKDRKGNTRIDCKADSLTLVITNLVRERDYYRYASDSSYVAGQRVVAELETKLEKETVKKSGGLGSVDVMIVLMAIVISGIAIWFCKKMTD